MEPPIISENGGGCFAAIKLVEKNYLISEIINLDKGAKRHLYLIMREAPLRLMNQNYLKSLIIIFQLVLLQQLLHLVGLRSSRRYDSI